METLFFSFSFLSLFFSITWTTLDGIRILEDIGPEFNSIIIVVACSVCIHSYVLCAISGGSSDSFNAGITLCHALFRVINDGL